MEDSTHCPKPWRRSKTLSHNTQHVILSIDRKANVSSGQSELEKLEAKLRETEQRLAKVSRQNSPSRQAATGASRETVPANEPAKRQSHPLSQRPTYPEDRPPTGGRPQTQRENTQEITARMPGAMPETPDQVNVREDYVMVDNARR